MKEIILKDDGSGVYQATFFNNGCKYRIWAKYVNGKNWKSVLRKRTVI